MVAGRVAAAAAGVALLAVLRAAASTAAAELVVAARVAVAAVAEAVAVGDRACQAAPQAGVKAAEGSARERLEARAVASWVAVVGLQAARSAAAMGV